MQHQMFQPYDQNLLQCPPARPGLIIDRRWKPTSSASEPAPRCPRCDSSNTKFCYYNNYSLTQPRYFCKGCRRYWTKGGSLRNIPVGGGCRKNRRTKSARVSSSGQNHHARESESSIKSDGTAESSTLSGSSTEAAATSDGSTIDLAAVYAKFLNPTPTDHEHRQISTLSQLSDQLDSSSRPCYSSTLPPVITTINNNKAILSTFQTEPINEFQPDSTGYAIGQSAGALEADSFWGTNYDQVDTDFNWQSTLIEQPLDDHLNIQSNYFNNNWTTPFDLSQL